MRLWFLMALLAAGSVAAQTIETFTGPNGETCTRATDMHGQVREECVKADTAAVPASPPRSDEAATSGTSQPPPASPPTPTAPAAPTLPK